MDALAFGLIAALAWGIHDILVRYISRDVSIPVSLFFVLTFGILAQLPLVLLFGDTSNLSAPSIWLSVAAGLFFSIACIGHYNAFKRGPVRIVAPLIGCYSVLSFLIAVASGTAISLPQWSMLVILIAGIALVARGSESPEDEEDTYPLTPTLMYCGMAIIGFAITFALGQQASATSDPLTSGIITRVSTTLIVGCMLAVIIIRSSENYEHPTRRSFLILASMGCLDAIALGVVLAAGIFARPEFASASSSIFGLVTVILAWVFMKEQITRVQWLGILLVFASISYLSV